MLNHSGTQHDGVFDPVPEIAYLDGEWSNYDIFDQHVWSPNNFRSCLVAVNSRLVNLTRHELPFCNTVNWDNKKHEYMRTWKDLLNQPTNWPMLNKFSQLKFPKLSAVTPGRKDMRRITHHSSVFVRFLLSSFWISRPSLKLGESLHEGTRMSRLTSGPPSTGNKIGQGKFLSLKNAIASFSASTKSPCSLSAEFNILRTYSPCSSTSWIVHNFLCPRT